MGPNQSIASLLNGAQGQQQAPWERQRDLAAVYGQQAAYQGMLNSLPSPPPNPVLLLLEGGE